jgi:hypothetical protein
VSDEECDLVAGLTRERDEARAEVKRLKAENAKLLLVLGRIAVVRLKPGDFVRLEQLTAAGQAVVDMRNWARTAVGLPEQDWSELLAVTENSDDQP